jgi:hypothetical protein
LKRKARWLVQKLLVRRKQKQLRKSLRHAENLSETEEKVIDICEPETRKNLSDEDEMRTTRGLMNFQEGRDEFLDL